MYIVYSLLIMVLVLMVLSMILLEKITLILDERLTVENDLEPVRSKTSQKNTF